jgi:hypothetical protein
LATVGGSWRRVAKATGLHEQEEHEHETDDLWSISRDNLCSVGAECLKEQEGGKRGAVVDLTGLDEGAGS